MTTMQFQHRPHAVQKMNDDWRAGRVVVEVVAYSGCQVVSVGSFV